MYVCFMFDVKCMWNNMCDTQQAWKIVRGTAKPAKHIKRKQKQTKKNKSLWIL